METDDSDDYCPEKNSSSSDDNSDDNDDTDNEIFNEDEDDDKYLENNMFKPNVNLDVLPQARTRKITGKFDEDFIIHHEDYFTHHASSKVFTSNRTLDSLKTPRLQADQLFKLLESLRLSQNHENAIHQIINEYKNNFRKWMFLLDEGFSILLYGLGSKRSIIESFQNQMLTKHDIVVVNGFFPGISMKEVLENIANKLLELNLPLANLNSVVDLIEEELGERSNYHLFLLVHNIDGIMLRNDKAQVILSRLSKIKNVHLVASVDHINAPMRKISI